MGTGWRYAMSSGPVHTVIRRCDGDDPWVYLAIILGLGVFAFLIGMYFALGERKARERKAGKL